MSSDTRLEQLENWLHSLPGLTPFTIEPASADASFRRYFRVTSHQQNWVAMDAPPQQEDCEPFVHVAQMIEATGVRAPHIYHRDKAQGFMLLSDLGSTPYLAKLDDDCADQLYRDAIDSLVKMQNLQNGLPAYDSELLQREMALFRDWYIGRHLGIELTARQSQTLQAVFDLLQDNALQQQQVFVHRDYHSRNLMITDADNPGVIDFQDAVIGPVSYDLVSLLKDCYIAWPRERILQWLQYFVEQSPFVEQPDESFIRAFELMGVQRHLKASGIFARLNHRDGKPGYLNDIPRTLAYIIDVCGRYAELQPMYDLLDELGIQGDRQTLELIR
jgi:aminoglycoside/choline kinase family phosphotransferase